MENLKKQKKTSNVTKSSIENDVNVLRSHLLNCSSMSSEGEAIKVALAALDDVIFTEDEDLDSSTGSASPLSFSPNAQHDSANKDEKDVLLPATRREYTSQNVKNNRNGNLARTVPNLARCTLVDLPLMALFALFIFTLCLQHIFVEYLEPQLYLMEWTDQRAKAEITYYQRICDENDLSTDNAEDLLIGEHFTTDDCVDHMMVHGMSMYPEILRQDTAETLREYILKRNAELKDDEKIHVIENENRWSFGIGVNDDPIIPVALKELTTHSLFRPALDEIVGPNAAVIELTAITSAYGADDQFWHADVLAKGSALKYSRSFAPSYSLFIPLQDTTAGMGATEVCPGTSMCTNEDPTPICEEFGFQASGEGTWKTGYGIFMNQQSFHRGPAFRDPRGPHRVLFILTFAPRPLSKMETRQLSQGGSYSIRWDMWGHTVKDLEDAPTAMSQPWATLRSLGIYKPKEAEWGWDFISIVSMRIANEDTGYKVADLFDFVEQNTEKYHWFSMFVADLTDESTWESFLLDTIAIWKEYAMFANIGILAFYLFSVICISVFTCIAVSKKDVDPPVKNNFWLRILKPILRLAITHGSIYVIGLCLMNHLAGTDWAKDIKSGCLYTPKFSSTELDVVKRPSTFAHSQDILIGVRFDSDVLASVNKVLDFHPGNLIWNSRLTGASSVYRHAGSADKDKIIQNLKENSLKGGSRFLLQNSVGDWTVLSESEIETYIRRSLVLMDNGLLHSLKDKASYLLSDFDGGDLSSKLMAKQFNPLVMNKLLPEFFHNVWTSPWARSSNIMKSYAIYPRVQLTPPPDAKTLQSGYFSSSMNISASYLPLKKEPISNTLKKKINEDEELPEFILQEGDHVEAQFNGKYNEWYKGTIIRVFASGISKVIYDDGDKDFVPEESIRSFEEFFLHEIIESKKNSGSDWERAKIRKILKGNNYGVFFSDGEYLDVPRELIRRFDWEFVVGDAVACRYRGEGKQLFFGNVVAKRKDGTYNVKYHDGAVEFGVISNNMWFEWEV